MSKLDASVTETSTGRMWTVRSEQGAVSLELISAEHGVFGPIVIHSPRPLYGEDHREPTQCPVIGTCHPDAAYRAGDTLGRTWQTSGQDDRVIWGQLESWFTMRLVKSDED